MSNASESPALRHVLTRAIFHLWVVLGSLAIALSGAAAQAGPLARIERFEGVERIEVGHADVLYSVGPGGEADRAEHARRIAARFDSAAAFFADRFGGELHYTLALLSPRHWNRVGGVQPLPWSDEADRLLVVPIQPDVSLLLPSGQDTARARRVLEVIGYHQLGHVVTAASLHPAGYYGATPVRWFGEVLASYFAHWYMRENEPELADFAEELARDVTRRTEPRFSSLQQYDSYHDGYLSSPRGANTLGWYQNAFNLRAAELYDRHGPGFFEDVRTELPWVRLETWTSDLVLEELAEFAPGFRGWAEEMAERTGGRY